MKILLASLLVLMGACSLNPFHSERDPSSIVQVGDYRPKELTNEKVLEYSSSKNLEISELKIITDNTDALNSKIDIIRKAQSDLVMMYYIFSFDESSSYFTKEILAAANRGVKVKILVDFFVNYKNYDSFKMLEEKSNGNIQVSFYGVPALPLLKSVSYIASPCKEQNKSCVEKKWNEIEQEYSTGKAPFFTRLAMTGLYGKNSNAAKLGLLTGSQIDLSSTAKITEQEKAQLEEFLKLVFKAKVKGDVGAKLKLAAALTFYGKDTLPIYEKLLALFPLAGGQKDLSNYWNNATDFIHHKLIMADNKYVQLGGRNIEDSYHMPLSPSGKYTFLDTDVYAEVKNGNDIRYTFDRMWNFTDSVKPLKNLDPVVTHTFLPAENLPALMGAIKMCEAQKESPSYASCVETAAESQIALKMPQRIAKAYSDLEKLSAKYLKNNIAHAPTSIAMNDPAPFVTYLENLSFTRKSNKRLFGAGGDKNITELWVKSVRNTCQSALKSPKVPHQITFLNAYVFMPAAVYTTLGDVLSGRMRCPNTTVTIATNSINSTDLAPVNVFATYQLMLLAKEVKKGSNVALNIVELKKITDPKNPTAEAKYSLHSKVSIFDNDLIIGSANADIRSYHMDSNNAFFIRNAPELSANYKNWVSNFTNPANGKFENKTAYYTALSYKDAQATNSAIFDMMVGKYVGKLKPDTQAKLKSVFMDICTDVYEESKYFLSPAIGKMDDMEKRRMVTPRMESFDSKYQVF